MRPRSSLSERERTARSKIAKLLHDQEVIAGSIVRTKQTCGKPTCRCKSGQKHTAVYVALKYNGKRRMFSVAAPRREAVGQAVANYKQMQRLLEVLSQECCSRLLDKGR